MSSKRCGSGCAGLACATRPAAIGALGRLVLPGRQDIGMLATALVGIAASLLGGILANIFDVGWIIQFLVAVALAAIGITLFASTEHRRAA